MHEAGNPSVSEAWDRIRFHDDDGNLAEDRSEDRWTGYVTAHAEDGSGARREELRDRAGQELKEARDLAENPQILQAADVDELEPEACLRNDTRFYPSLRAYEECVMPTAAQFARDCQCRNYMATGAAAGHEEKLIAIRHARRC